MLEQVSAERARILAELKSKARARIGRVVVEWPYCGWTQRNVSIVWVGDVAHWQCDECAGRESHGVTLGRVSGAGKEWTKDVTHLCNDCRMALPSVENAVVTSWREWPDHVCSVSFKYEKDDHTYAGHVTVPGEAARRIGVGGRIEIRNGSVVFHDRPGPGAITASKLGTSATTDDRIARKGYWVDSFTITHN